eukprot:2700635-Rhodomonas_salina.3
MIHAPVGVKGLAESLPVRPGIGIMTQHWQRGPGTHRLERVNLARMLSTCSARRSLLTRGPYSRSAACTTARRPASVALAPAASTARATHSASSTASTRPRVHPCPRTGRLVPAASPTSAIPAASSAVACGSETLRQCGRLSLASLCLGSGDGAVQKQRGRLSKEERCRGGSGAEMRSPRLLPLSSESRKLVHMPERRRSGGRGGKGGKGKRGRQHGERKEGRAGVGAGELARNKARGSERGRAGWRRKEGLGGVPEGAGFGAEEGVEEVRAEAAEVGCVLLPALRPDPRLQLRPTLCQ